MGSKVKLDYVGLLGLLAELRGLEDSPEVLELIRQIEEMLAVAKRNNGLVTQSKSVQLLGSKLDKLMMVTKSEKLQAAIDQFRAATGYRPDATQAPS